MVASEGALSVIYKNPIDFPNSPQSKKISLRIGCLPDMTLSKDLFSDGKASLPGLDVSLSGSFLSGHRAVTFSLRNKLHGASYYEVTFDLGNSSIAEPGLVIAFQKTPPPIYKYIL